MSIEKITLLDSIMIRFKPEGGVQGISVSQLDAYRDTKAGTVTPVGYAAQPRDVTVEELSAVLGTEMAPALAQITELKGQLAELTAAKAASEEAATAALAEQTEKAAAEIGDLQRRLAEATKQAEADQAA